MPIKSKSYSKISCVVSRYKTNLTRRYNPAAAKQFEVPGEAGVLANIHSTGSTLKLLYRCRRSHRYCNR